MHVFQKKISRKKNLDFRLMIHYDVHMDKPEKSISETIVDHWAPTMHWLQQRKHARLRDHVKVEKLPQPKHPL